MQAQAGTIFVVAAEVHCTMALSLGNKDGSGIVDAKRRRRQMDLLSGSVASKKKRLVAIKRMEDEERRDREAQKAITEELPLSVQRDLVASKADESEPWDDIHRDHVQITNDVDGLITVAERISRQFSQSKMGNHQASNL